MELIKELIENHGKIASYTFEKNMPRKNNISEIYARQLEIAIESSQYAVDVVEERLTEEELAGVINSVMASIASSHIQDGHLEFLEAVMSRSIISYTHTVVLTVIGVLMKEEII